MKKVYACVMMATFVEEVGKTITNNIHTTTIHFNASSLHEAKGMAIDVCNMCYRTQDGWKSHNVIVIDYESKPFNSVDDAIPYVKRVDPAKLHS